MNTHCRFLCSDCIAKCGTVEQAKSSKQGDCRKKTQTRTNQLTEEFDKAASAEESATGSRTESGEFEPNQPIQLASTQDITSQQKPEMNLDVTVGDLPEPGMLTTQFDAASTENQPIVTEGDSANSVIETVPLDTPPIVDPSHDSDFDHNLE